MDEKELLPGCCDERLEFIKRFRLIDDTFMTKVFEDKACVQLLLNVILGREDLTVTKVITQFEIMNLQGRSSRLDVYAVDNEGKHYDIEIQREDGGAIARRARYNNCLLDSNSLKERQDVDTLPETYIIFITEHDVLKGGKPLYTIHRRIEELDNQIFDDGTHIIYVNGEIRDNTGLGRLMQDFFCTDPDKMNNEVLSERTRYFKQTKEGYDHMCQIMQEYGELLESRKAKEFAVKLWEEGICDFEKISKLTDLPIDEVKELFKDKSA